MTLLVGSSPLVLIPVDLKYAYYFLFQDVHRMNHCKTFHHMMYQYVAELASCYAPRSSLGLLWDSTDYLCLRGSNHEVARNSEDYYCS